MSPLLEAAGMSEKDLTLETENLAVSWRTRGISRFYANKAPQSLPWNKNEIFRNYYKPWKKDNNENK